MVVIGSLSMVGDGGGRWEGVGTWEGVGRALGGRWRVVRVRPGSLIYRQIKSLHCSGYLLVSIYNRQIHLCGKSDPLNYFQCLQFVIIMQQVLSLIN